MSDNCDICVKFFTYNMDVPFFEHGLALIIFYQYVIVLWEGSMHATINSSWPKETSASSTRNLNSSRTHVRLGAWFWSAKADIFFSESLHILAERLSQSEIVLPLRKTCYYSPLAEVGVFSTEINAQFRNRTRDTRIFSPLLYQLS